VFFFFFFAKGFIKPGVHYIVKAFFKKFRTPPSKSYKNRPRSAVWSSSRIIRDLCIVKHERARNAQPRKICHLTAGSLKLIEKQKYSLDGKVGSCFLKI